MSKIAKNIKKLRTAKGMTQEELAAEIHVTRQTVSSWETNRTQPDLEILVTLAKVFDAQVEELIYGKRRNTAEEKEKLLFGNTLVTVLSVLGCLLIGAGVVMIFIKYWRDFPDALKMFSCFIPALLGQASGLYTYIKKRHSIAWCEGASVLWMLGTGVTTAILSGQADSRFVDEGFVMFFVAVCFFIIMLIFGSLASAPVVLSCSLIGYVCFLENMKLYLLQSKSISSDVIIFVSSMAFEAAFIAAVLYASSRLYKKESNIIRYRFSQWVNFAAVIAFIGITLANIRIDEGFISVAVLTALICFIFGQKQESLASPYKLVGTLGSAAALCFFSMVTYVEINGELWINTAVVIAGFIPACVLFNKKTMPENKYIRIYCVLLWIGLLIFNIAGFVNMMYLESDVSAFWGAADTVMELMVDCNFLVSLSGLVVLILYGAKERKLFYLNLGFVLSCVTVIAKLYLLNLGLIMTGIILIICGVSLLFINLKFSQLREKEKVASLNGGEEEEQ